MIIDKKDRKKIEKAFFNYNALKFVEDNLLEDTAFIGTTSNYNKMPGVANFGNAKESQFIKYVDKSTADKWVMVVDKTINKFLETGKDTLIKMKYFNMDSETKICRKLYINRCALYDWLNDILVYAAFQAIKQNLIHIE